MGSVAVMHVEIDDRHPFCTMRGLRVACRDRRIVEEAKPHWQGDPGMMARRPQCGKSVFDAAAHDLVHGRRGSADAMANRIKTLRAHYGVWIEMHSSPCGRRDLDRIGIVRGVNTQDCRAVKSGGIRPDQRREALVFEGLRYRPDAGGPLWMTRPGIVTQIR